MSSTRRNQTVKRITSYHLFGAFAIVLCSVLGILLSKFDAVLVFAATLSIGLLFFMFLNPEFTTLAVLFVLYTNLTVIATRYHGIPTFVAGSFFLLLGMPLLYFYFIRRLPIIVNSALLLMVGYLVAMVISAAVSRDFVTSVDRMATFFLAGIVLYFLIINTIRTKELLRKVTWTLILSGFFMGTISLYQELSGSYNNALGGLAQVKDAQISTGEVDISGEKIKRRRLAGPIGSKNRYAQIMVVLLPLAFFRIRGESSRFLRVLAVLSMIPILAGIMLTFSRGAGIAILFVLVIMVFLKFIKIRYFFLAIVFCISVMLVAVPHYFNRIYLSYVGITNVLSGQVHKADGSVRGRTTVSLAALKTFFDHPFFGVGPGQTSSYIPEYASEIGFRKISGTRRAHNMYIEELSDNGLFGASWFFAIILATLFKLNQTRRFHKKWGTDGENIASGFLLSILAYLFTAIFLHLSYVRFFWLLIALAGACVKIYGQESRAESVAGEINLEAKPNNGQLHQIPILTN